MQEKKQTEKKAYETPAVAELGSVQTLTQTAVDNHGSCVSLPIHTL